MRVVDSNGELFEMAKRKRMRATDLLVDRDLLMLEKHYEGRSQREVAKLFNVSQQFVGLRLRKVDPIVRERMREMVEESIRERGFSFLTERELSEVRSLHRRRIRQSREASARLREASA